MKPVKMTDKLRRYAGKWEWLLVDKPRQLVLLGYSNISDAQKSRFALFMGDFGYREPDTDIIPSAEYLAQKEYNRYYAAPSLIAQARDSGLAV